MLFLFWILNAAAAHLPATLPSAQPVEAVPQVNGIEILQNRVYLLGDAEDQKPGRIVEYRVVAQKLKPTGKTLTLSNGDTPVISHPTGLTHHPRFGTWMGSSDKEQGTLFQLHWSRLYHQGTLEDAVVHQVQDDAAVNGTRPEFVRHAGKVFLATADSGGQGNELRLYDPTRLARAKRTKEPGVIVHRFPVGPWIQSLHYWPAKGALILSQHERPGHRGRWTVLDLNASIQQSRAVELETVPLPFAEPLSAMHLLDNVVIAVFRSTPSLARLGPLPLPTP